MTETLNNIAEIARRQRYAALVHKMKGGKALNPSEIKWLDAYNRKAKKSEKAEPITAGKGKFTCKQQKFIDSYNGNIKEAAEKAGLSYRYCRKLVAKRNIMEAIQNRENTEIRPKIIATRQERQHFWTELMNNESEDTNDRLKASELLGKSEADFTENANLKTNDDTMDYLWPSERMKVLIRKKRGENISERMAKMTPAERLEMLKRSVDEQED
ncbi:MAG: hypothetical protein ABSB11_04640 [Sedimentisphaerales bacterium]|jgi:hypothetical protein